MGEKIRPKLRWMDGVELEFKECGCKRMEKKSLDRTEWAPAVRETKVKFHGCSDK